MEPDAADSSHTARSVLDDLLRHDSVEVRSAAAAHPAVAEDQLVEAMADGRLDERFIGRRSVRIHPAVLTLAAHHTSSRVRRAAATRRDLVTRERIALLNDPEYLVREGVHLTVLGDDVELLDTASVSPFEDVRLALAASKYCGPVHIECLLADRLLSVRKKTVADNPNVSLAQVVRVSLEDRSREVRNEAYLSKRLPNHWRLWIRTGWSLLALSRMEDAGFDFAGELLSPWTLESIVLAGELELSPDDLRRPLT